MKRGSFTFPERVSVSLSPARGLALWRRKEVSEVVTCRIIDRKRHAASLVRGNMQRADSVYIYISTGELNGGGCNTRQGSYSATSDWYVQSMLRFKNEKWRHTIKRGEERTGKVGKGGRKVHGVRLAMLK